MYCDAICYRLYYKIYLNFETQCIEAQKSYVLIRCGFEICPGDVTG